MSSDPLSNVQAEQPRMVQIGFEVNGGASFENRSENGPAHEISRLGLPLARRLCRRSRSSHKAIEILLGDA